MCFSAPSLFHIQRSNAQPDPCCEDSNLRTCQRVNVDQKTLASENDISILGKEYQFSNFIEPSSYAYKTANGDEAVITLNQETGNMFASVKTNDGKSYGIEKCHTGHVWKEFGAALEFTILFKDNEISDTYVNKMDDCKFWKDFYANS